MPSSLRARLLLLFVVVLLANCAITAWQFKNERDDGFREATTALLSHARLIVAQQKKIADRADAILGGLTELTELRPGGSAKDCDRKLAARLRAAEQFRDAIVATPSGVVMCSTNPSVHGVNFADRNYFQHALTTDKTVASGVIVLREPGGPSIVFAKSLRDERGDTVAVAIVALDLRWLEQELKSVGLDDGEIVIVVDHDGNIAAHVPDSVGYVGSNIAHTKRFELLRAHAGAGTFEVVGLDGQPRLYAHDNLIETVSGPVHLSVSVPIAVVEAPVLRHAITNLGVSTAVLLATLTILLWGAERLILRPVKVLARTAARLSTGGPVARSDLPHDESELGTLACALDGAATMIAEREQRLAASEQRYRRLNELSSDWIWERDELLRITYISPSYLELSGETAESIVGRPATEYFQKEDKALSAPLLAHRAFRNLETALRRPDGTLFWRSVSGEPITDESGDFKGFQGTGSDISERKHHESELHRMATTDALTGLPNRTVLLDRIEQAIKRASRSQHSFAVVMLDLDDFKQINDAIGHESGDAILRLAAVRLKGCVRAQDTLARTGGDEFIAVLEDLGDEESVRGAIDRLHEVIAEPTEVQGRVLHTSASSGVALYPRDGTDATELLRSADAAMYHAKSIGRGTSHFFTQSLNDRVARHVALRAQLEVALERAEFELYYQPIIDCSDDRIVGAEALLRWHRAGTLVAPGEFLDVAEDTGLIVPIGKWALREACMHAQTWPARNGVAPYVSVNLSARQFHHRDLTGEVGEALVASGLPPGRLVLELTESTMMRDLEAAAATLEEIAVLGVQLAIDDFGTGHSSLAYLKRFPVRTLKIDKSFVQDAPTNADDASIVRAVIELAHALDLLVVAEGVETDEQAALLRALGCDRIQGYRFGRPMPLREFEALLNHSPLAAEDVSGLSVPGG